MNDKSTNGNRRGGCPLCGRAAGRKLFSGGGVSVLVCDGCAVGFVSPMPAGEKLRTIYGREYFGDGGREKGYADYEAEAGLDNKWARYYWEERLSDVERHAGGRRGRLLEAGCAYGAFLELARERGWEVDGVEISPHAAEVAGKRLGTEVFCGTLEESPFAEGRYDAVAAFEVIEHIPEPRPFVRRANALLKPGGIFVLTTPNDLFSLRARLVADKRQLVKLPEHVVFYSPRGLSRLLREEGFSVAASHTFEAKSLRKGRDLAEKRLGGLYRAVRPALRPVWRFLVNRLGLGEAVFCAAEKPNRVP